jgi:hypothetical protein
MCALRQGAIFLLFAYGLVAGPDVKTPISGPLPLLLVRLRGGLEVRRSGQGHGKMNATELIAHQSMCILIVELQACAMCRSVFSVTYCRHSCFSPDPRICTLVPGREL